MTDQPKTPISSWIIAILAVLLALAVGFGVAQYKIARDERGENYALLDTMHYYRGPDSVLHAYRAELQAGTDALKLNVDSLNRRLGGVVEELIRLQSHGTVTIPVAPGTFKPSPITYDPSNPAGAHGRPTGADTPTYVMTAQDTLDLIRSNGLHFNDPWDTITAYLDKAKLTIRDSLTIAVVRKSSGGLFNKTSWLDVDVTHQNPLLQVSNIRSWRQATPIKRWGIGPALMAYPAISAGHLTLKGAIGVSLQYNLIRF